MIERIRAADMYTVFLVATKLNEVIDHLNSHDDGENCETMADLRRCPAVPVMGRDEVDVRTPIALWREIESPKHCH